MSDDETTQNDECCPNCGAPEGTRIRGVYVCGSDKHQGGHRSTACEYAAGIVNENDWLKREADAADKRAERAKAIVDIAREWSHTASPAKLTELREALEADDE